VKFDKRWLIGGAVVLVGLLWVSRARAATAGTATDGSGSYVPTGVTGGGGGGGSGVGSLLSSLLGGSPAPAPAPTYTLAPAPAPAPAPAVSQAAAASAPPPRGVGTAPYDLSTTQGVEAYTQHYGVG